MRGGFSVGRAAEVTGAGRSALRESRGPVALRVVVCESCPRWLALAARDALVPARGGARLIVGDDRAAASREACDAALVLGGSDGAGAAAASRLAASGEPTALVLPAGSCARAPEGAELLEVASADGAAGVIGPWLAGACARPLALASAFPVCRAAVCEELVRACAARNATVAALPLVRGADLPVMCANQVALALELAAAHGRGAGLARVADIGGVCALGALWRACARAIARRSALPGRVVGALVAAAGTVATGAVLSARLSVGEALPRGAAGGEAAPAPGRDASEEDGYVTIGEAR
ncbi:hypothetical protein [Thermophilibacter sp.]